MSFKCHFFILPFCVLKQKLYFSWSLHSLNLTKEGTASAVFQCFLCKHRFISQYLVPFFQVLFLLCIFGYLGILIFYKWITINVNSSNVSVHGAVHVIIHFHPYSNEWLVANGTHLSPAPPPPQPLLRVQVLQLASLNPEVSTWNPMHSNSGKFLPLTCTVCSFIAFFTCLWINYLAA